MVERARRYAAVLREEPGLTQGQLAEREGVSGARDELFGIGPLSGGRAPVARYRAVCAALAGERVGVKVQAARQRGFQQLFARARVWQAALDSGQFRSLSELAKSDGLSHHRVAQVLDLLTLPPESQGALDVPFEELPAGITQADVRALARMGDAEAQREAFSTLRTGSGCGTK